MLNALIGLGRGSTGVVDGVEAAVRETTGSMVVSRSGGDSGQACVAALDLPFRPRPA